MKRYITCFIALFSFIILNVLIIFNIYYNKNEVFRLHIVSNSNSISDLIEKLKVNENVTNYIKTLNLQELNSKQDIENKIYKNIDTILDITNSTLKKDNVKYLATARYGKIYYCQKEDIDITMKDGVYDSLQIILGEGNGENIWSLIFPDESDIENISCYETIIPGISKIYDENIEKNTKQKPKSIIIESIKNLKKCLEENSRH